MSTETNINARFYPNLNSIVNTEELPEILEAINAGNALGNLLEKIFFRDLQYSKSDTNDAAFYSLSLIARERLALDIPGLDISFVLNPDLTGGDSQVSVFPITFEYEWKILGLVRDFNTDWLDFSTPDNENLGALFQFALRALNLSEEQVMANFVNSFYDPTNSSLSPIEQFVETINTSSFLSAEIDDSVDYTLKDLTQIIYDLSGSQYSSIIACGVYLLTDTDVAVNLQNVKSFFRSFLPQDLETYLKDMLVPKFSCSLQLSAGIEFPRSILKPVYLFDGSNPYDSSDGFTPTSNPEEAHSRAFQLVPPIDGVEQKALVKAAQWDINFSTESGFGSDLEVVLSTPQPYQIGNTNVIIDVESLSIPFRIQGEPQPAHFYGTVTFRKEEEGENEQLGVRLDVYEDGFELDVESINGVTLLDIDTDLIKVKTILKKLGIKKEGSDYDFTIGGKIEADISIPKLGDIFPKLIDVRELAIRANEPNTYDLDVIWPGGAKISGTSGEPLTGYIPWGGVFPDPLLSIDGINFKVDDEGEENGLDLAVTFKNLLLDLRIVEFRFDGIGADIRVTRPADESEANLGGLKVNIGFNPPEGIGIKTGKGASLFYIDGYLYIDNDAKRYYGLIEVRFAAGTFVITFTALALYEETLPDGTEGNSFLALINTKFVPPVPLFTNIGLEKAGGIVGVNRTFISEEMIKRVRNGTLDLIMFPELSIDSFDPTLEAMESIFPAEDGRNTFGLLAQLGSPGGPESSLIVDLGIIVSVPSPVVFALFGVVKFKEDATAGTLVNIKGTFAIIVDLGTELLSIDATLNDSRLGINRIEGELALRYGWGDNRQFLLTVGGFHPNYTTDSFNLPELARVSFMIIDTDDIKYRCNAYFAVTTNTVMFGNKGHFLFQVNDRFKVESFSGFDVLLQFNPFRFEVDWFMEASLIANGRELLLLSLNAYVKGPGEWHVRGDAEVKIFGINLKIKFDEEFGSADQDDIITLDTMDYLMDEIEKKENWSSSLGADDSVHRKDFDFEDDILLSSSDSIRIDQMAIPLSTRIDKIFTNKVERIQKISVSSIQLASEAEPTSIRSINPNYIQDKEDYFAPAQYIQLSDAEKLEAKSFEKMPSGVDFTYKLGWQSSVHSVPRNAVYEVKEPSGTLTGVTNSPLRNSIVNKPFGGQLSANGKFNKNRRTQRNKKVRINTPEYILVDKMTGDIEFSSKSKTAVKVRKAELDAAATSSSSRYRSVKNTSNFSKVSTIK
ncbi:MAG: DUF6603 domain-containing protein [Flavobacteriales bacterium]